MKVELTIDDIKKFCKQRANMLDSCLSGTDENETLFKSLFHQRFGSKQAYEDVLKFIEHPVPEYLED